VKPSQGNGAGRAIIVSGALLSRRCVEEGQDSGEGENRGRGKGGGGFKDETRLFRRVDIWSR